MYKLFLSGEEGDCLGWKPSPEEPYKWMTYNEVWLENMYQFLLIWSSINLTTCILKLSFTEMPIDDFKMQIFGN